MTSGFKLLYQRGDEVSVVVDNAEVGDVEDRRVCGLVHGHDALCIPHAELILHGAGYGDVDNDLRRHGDAALADLLVVLKPAAVDQWPRRGQLSTQQFRQLPEHGQV